MRNKFLIEILAVLVVLLVVSTALAGKPESKLKAVAIPSKAVEISPGVFYLGEALDKGKIVEGYAFVRYKEGHGKPVGCNNDGACQGWEDSSCADCQGGGEPTTDTSSCYSFLAKGAKWKSIEPYIVNPANIRNLNEGYILNNLGIDIEKWETAATANILGDEISGVVDGADTISPDNKNEMYFADIANSGAIAITIVWGYFGGPPFARELIEWDQVYDDVDFDWSSTGEANKMDFENIATHELGHSVGLGDLYTSICSEMTMYGYAGNGETKKQTLEDGDITGIKKLYS